MSITTEKELIEAIGTGLTGVEVAWGFLEFETDGAPPSLPWVCVTRLNAATQTDGLLADMCDDGTPIAQTMIQIDSWEKGYEDARTLNDQVNAIVEAEGWTWQSDVDIRDSNLKAWRIQSTWIQNGER